MRGARIMLSIFVAATALAAAPAVSAGAEYPCRTLETGNHTADVADAAPGTGPLRVFAMQFRQDVAYVGDYAAFEHKMDCLMRRYVVPHLATDKVNLVVFNEDIGLATIATGSRGIGARTIASAHVPSIFNTQAGAPAGAAAALGAVAAGYARQLAAYRTRFPDEDPRKAILTAATDTFVRGFMTTFSKLAVRYGVWVVAANNQGDFHYSTDPADVAAFADPDLAGEYAAGRIRGVWVADAPQVWNEAFLWSPQACPEPASPLPHEDDPRCNLRFTNKKVPLTQIEKDFLALDEGDESPANTGPVTIDGLPGFRFGFAISLPAFQYGSGDPCVSGATWMNCLDARGVNTVLQPEANPGPWADYSDGGHWQALTWSGSTLRAVTDPSVGFAYLVCPHMVGNLVDLPFDGQSAIVARAMSGTPRHYVGTGAFLPGDPSGFEAYAGDSPRFLALAPWAIGDTDRAALQARSTAMQSGSGSPDENGYLETAIYADLQTPA